MPVLAELKRRNVLRVGLAYVITAWLMIQVAETIFPLFGFSDMPARLVVILLALGLVPTLILAWIFEWTPEGVKRQRDVDRSQSITARTGQRLDRAIMIVLVLALGYFAIDKFVLSPRRHAELEQDRLAAVEHARQQGRSEALVELQSDTSIAVLAFEDMSPDGDQEYLSDGIAEELLNLLAKIPELRVISRSSAFSFKARNLEIPEIAQRLKVGYILEGSVRKAGSAVRISAQLIEARSDTNVWSETYDRSLDDIFAVQDDIAAAVVAALKLELLGPSPVVEETDPEAYAKYLQANYLTDIGTVDSVQNAVALYREVVGVDPGYVPGWLGLGTAYDHLAALRVLPAEEAHASSLDALLRAEAIDPESASVHSHLAWRLFKYSKDLPAAARHFQRALDLEPTNVRVIGNVSVFLTSLGRLEEGVRFAEYSTNHDPANAVAYNNLGIRYRYSGQYAKAIEAFSDCLTLSPGFGGANYELGVTLMLTGEFEAAAEAFAAEPLQVFSQIGLAMSHQAQGEWEQSERLVEQLTAGYGSEIAYYLAQVMALRRDVDAAFDWLEKARLLGDRELTNVINEPLFDALKADPRWLPFLESIGESPAQLAAIEFTPTLPKKHAAPGS